MKSIQAFNDLHQKEVTRQEIERVILLAKEENQTDIIYRLSKALNNHPEEEKLTIIILQYNKPLNAPKHSGIYKEALDDCGRLRKGFKFENGTVVKVEKPQKKQSKVISLKDKILQLKSKFNIKNYDSFPQITKSLNGVLLADGHTVLTEKERLIYLDQENTG